MMNATAPPPGPSAPGRGPFAALTAGHVEALDGLRGLALLIVLASHLSNAGFLPRPGLSGTGKSGVYLFFVLSAFLLARPLICLAPAAFADARRWCHYAARRALRIVPLYVLVLLLSWALTRAQLPWHYVIDDTALVRHLTMRDGQSVLWSIPVEFTFYVVLPAVALLAASLRRAVFAAAALLACIAVATWMWPPSSAVGNDVRLGPYLGVFLCGVLAARLDPVMRAGSPAARTLLGLAGVAGLMLWLASVPSILSLVTGDGFEPARNAHWFLFFGVAWGALLLAVLHGPMTLAVPLRSAPMRAAGRVSYSAYLWHMPVIDLVARSGMVPGVARTLLACAAIAAVSALSYRLVERPLQRLHPFAARS